MPRGLRSLDDLPPSYQKQAIKKLDSLKRHTHGKKAIRSKFGNTPVVDPDTGERVDSKLEAKHRAEYRLALRAGHIRGYATQVEIHLADKIHMRVDHLIVRLDGKLEYVDSKGAPPTKDWLIKQKLAAEKGITVQIRG